MSRALQEDIHRIMYGSVKENAFKEGTSEAFGGETPTNDVQEEHSPKLKSFIKSRKGALGAVKKVEQAINTLDKKVSSEEDAQKYAKALDAVNQTLQKIATRLK